MRPRQRPNAREKLSNRSGFWRANGSCESDRVCTTTCAVGEGVAFGAPGAMNHFAQTRVAAPSPNIE